MMVVEKVLWLMGRVQENLFPQLNQCLQTSFLVALYAVYESAVTEIAYSVQGKIPFFLVQYEHLPIPFDHQQKRFYEGL
jgi:hypothetical protein